MSEVLSRLDDIAVAIADLRMESIWFEFAKLVLPFIAGSCVPLGLFLLTRRHERLVVIEEWLFREFVEEGTRKVLVDLMGIDKQLPYSLLAHGTDLVLPEVDSGAMSRFEEITGRSTLQSVLWTLQAQYIAVFKKKAGADIGFATDVNLSRYRSVLVELRKYVLEVQDAILGVKLKSRQKFRDCLDKKALGKSEALLMQKCLEAFPELYTRGRLKAGATADEIAQAMLDMKGEEGEGEP